MQLTDKLNSISKSEVGAVFAELLFSKINWCGYRVVSIEGYEGTVKIDDLASLFLSALPRCMEDNTGCNQEYRLFQFYERMRFYVLWGKLQEIYQFSDAVSRTGFVSSLLVDTEGLLFPTSTTMSIICERERCYTQLRESLRQFKSWEFRMIWPREYPKSKYSLNNGSTVCVATRDQAFRVAQKIGNVTWKDLCYFQKREQYSWRDLSLDVSKSFG